MSNPDSESILTANARFMTTVLPPSFRPALGPVVVKRMFPPSMPQDTGSRVSKRYSCSHIQNTLFTIAQGERNAPVHRQISGEARCGICLQWHLIQP